MNYTCKQWLKDNYPEVHGKYLKFYKNKNEEYMKKYMKKYKPEYRKIQLKLGIKTLKNHLTKEDILNMREEFENNDLTRKELSKKYKTSYANIVTIINKKSWKTI